MKKYFAMIALAALMLGACENIQVVEDPADGVTTIHAITGANMTKTVLKDFDVNWNTGDKLAVADEDDTVVEFTLEGDGGSDEGTFEGELNGKRLGTYAVYPYTANASVSGTTVTVDYLASWAYGTTEVPMWGENDGTGEYDFNNIGGAVLVSYSNVPATTNAKTFVLTSTVNITGTVTVSGLDKTPSARLTTGGNTVTITNVPGTETAVSFVVPVLAGTGYTFTAALKDGDNVVPGTSKTATNRTITANKITKFPDVDLTPVINLASTDPMEVASTASTQTINYSISNVAATETVSAVANVSWISNFTYTGTTVTFAVAQQPAGAAARSGEITLSYPGAADVVVDVKQDPAPVINVSTTPLYVYVAKAGQNGITIYYTIDNPTGESLSASAPTWITTDDNTPDVVTFNVSANTGDAQIGVITLSYPGANDVEFSVSQEGRVYTLSGSSANTTQADIDDHNIAWDRGVLTGNPWTCTTTKGATKTVTIYSTTSMQYNVTSFEVATGSSTTATINSTTISVYANSSDASTGSNAVSTESASSITNTSGSDWSSYYYRIEYVLAGHKGNQTKYFYFDSAVFYGYKIIQ